MKKIISWITVAVIATFMLSGCASKESDATVTVFAARSLNAVMDELISIYSKKNPTVNFITNYESSGTLQNQIEEGAICDVFFSAAQSQMNNLEAKGYIVEGTRADIVNNRVCVVASKGSATEVTGLNDIEKAKSLAIAAGSVPVGKYTRVALVNLGKLENTTDAATITTEEISKALGGVVINECANVGAVAVAVAEGANEVGTVYYSDYRGYEDRMDIIEIVPTECTGEVVYPAAVIRNTEATAADREAAIQFMRFLKSNEAKSIFQKYCFDVDMN